VDYKIWLILQQSVYEIAAVIAAAAVTKLTGNVMIVSCTSEVNTEHTSHSLHSSLCDTVHAKVNRCHIVYCRFVNFVRLLKQYKILN